MEEVLTDSDNRFINIQDLNGLLIEIMTTIEDRYENGSFAYKLLPATSFDVSNGKFTRLEPLRPKQSSWVLQISDTCGRCD